MPTVDVSSYALQTLRSIPISAVGFVDPLLDPDGDLFVREKQETADRGGCDFADDVTDMIPSDPNDHRQQSGQGPRREIGRNDDAPVAFERSRERVENADAAGADDERPAESE